MIELKKLACAALSVTAFLVGGGTAQAQSAPFPTKPVTLVVPFAAVGTADVVARVLAEKVSADLGQSVLVDNRTGGGGLIGAQAVARARPDGYTLLQISTAHVILAGLRQDLPYDLKHDFAPVFGTSAVPQALAVNAKSNTRSIPDLVATAKSMAGGINYSTGGTGSLSHLTSARLVQALKVNATPVPYRGLSGAAQAVLGNQVQFTIVNIPDVIELANSGDLRLLAVTSEQRLPNLPNVPTMAELGFPDLTSASWTSYLAPAGTPSDTIDRLYTAFAKAASDAGVQERLGKLGVVTRARNGAELGRFMNDESGRWRRIIEENQIKLEN